MSETSLRERSKARRRRAIQLAGMHLFAKQGYEATTLSDIGSEADVAPRTVSLYFATKLDIAQSSASDATERLISALKRHQSRPGTSMAELVVGWLSEEPHYVDAEEWDLRAGMYRANPSLLNTGSWEGGALGAVSGQVLASELEVPASHLAVRLSGGAIAGMLMHYTLLARHSDQTPESLGVVHGLIQGIIGGARHALTAPRST